MKNKTTRFLIASLIGVVVLCVCVFSFLTSHMRKQSTRTIIEVGTIYMSSMSKQISMHFETTIALRLDQLNALVQSVEPDRVHEDEELLNRLIEDARARDFDYLAFYTRDGELETLYGDQLEIVAPEPFLNSLVAGGDKVAIGIDPEGEKMVLLGVPTHHDPKEGRNCAALVAGLPVQYIRDTLSLDENDEHVYSFIIREDGSYVIRSADAYGSNYFERVKALYEDVGGMTKEEYMAQLRSAMARGEEYSAEFAIHGERRHLYCTRLAYSEWYLLTFMPYSTMDSSVTRLSRQWGVATVLSGGTILAALLLVFLKYFDLTQKQLREVEEARTAAEEAQREAEHANRAKSEFLSNMSHDIRTPMNAIVGMTAIATANMSDHRQIQNCLKKITLSSKHLLGLINDVLDMSKIESGKMTLNIDQVSLREVVDGVVAVCQPQIKTKHQRFDVFIHDISTENVLCDSVRLNQVMLNLLSNAIKFTPDGGEIHMALYEEESPKGADHVRIHLQVRDNGIGMSDAFREHIFDSFAREDSTRVHRTEGTGLGMAITKFIVVDAMGGAIDVKSKQGEGSEFNVTLDLEKAQVMEEDMVLPNWNMLVADDDRQLCESTVRALESIGVKAEWSLDGESAVERAVERHERGDGYHIILLDWKLPDMDGIATARRIRQETGGDMPIMLISAYDWSEIEHDAREAGITGFIGKPLFKSTLFNSLRRFAEEGEAEEAPQEETRHELKGRHILLAEDNELNWEVASELLSEEGLVLDWAENGQICVDMFQKSPVGGYDAILMDVRMPIMGGYDATRAIRALDRPDRSLPIIAMTADAFAEDVKRCLDCGMNAHVSKPIDVGEVMRLLEKYIWGSAGQGRTDSVPAHVD